MTFHDHPGPGNRSPGGIRSFRIRLVLLGFLIVAGALLFTEHRAHVLGALIYLPLLLCLFMHLFMHHGHGGHRDRTGPNDPAGTNGRSEP